ncbi:hypothetical protein [Nocardiopsis suaedae]|uniref:Uncharacterized protein n=1 Tax=Nocardiopsis suaedae TaxID=3018444 RepID=A0ABT4TSF5_9ACTN|nr:hypothetical protein [Nocardiopsis suaedae]MDA2807626.1 hypothetical protein [Nocardiopsis suaedae]
MSDSPLALARDRFPTGLPGHRVPIRPQPCTPGRPWGMDRAREMPAAPATGKHGKPTSTRQETVPTEYTDDSRTRRDDYTQTVTD